ncbi:PAS domain S-box-containing protein [Geoalkalibacter ferrihydriticus]|uniref:histidine kinase n=1 Tax=Geoalkalibacter ferrihydriticus TaxID=392333 RepID=A0A1G9W5G5_9BACT|nr:ATP-binding protein [Geoalkalibacter ferrihydriticus]SDM79749.1 PAS domain S-box-containing protein [Geoalkalibacter ferrihydriticus]
MSGDHRRTVLLLVWTLVSIGLLSGALTNGLVGWTLLTLNRERIQMFEQDRQLVQSAERLQRLGQDARSDISLLLQGNLVRTEEFSADEFTAIARTLANEFVEHSGARTFDDLHAAGRDLADLRSQAMAWVMRYIPVAADQREKRTLGQMRLLLEEMRAAAETLEGRQRLEEAKVLRRWRQADARHSAALAQEFLEMQADLRSRIVKEVRTELAELSRLVETLAGEDQLDHLADLRDNQLKPVLDRLEQQLLWLAQDDVDAAGLAPGQVLALRDGLFGRGHQVLAEYQTIRLGEGGLFRLSADALLLRQEREGLQERAQELFARIEQIHPVMAELASLRSRTVTRQAEESLMRGLSNLMLLSVLVMGGFLGLGWLISRRVGNQVRIMGRLRRHNELILNSAGEGILGLDRTGRASFINPAGARLLGSPADEIIGGDHRRIFYRSPDGQTPPCATPGLLNQVLQDGAVIRDEDHLFLRPDGSAFSGEYTATPIHNERGLIEGAVVTFVDITARKQADAALKKTLAELDDLNRSLEVKVVERTQALEEKNRELLRTQEELVRKEKLAAIGSLASGVAHEINNPAAIIRGNVEILRRRLKDEDAGREEVLEILKHTERISRITQSLLLFAREQNLPPAAREDVEINALLDDILAQASHQVSFAGIEVVRSFAADLPLLAADREKLRQVFTNLVLNAVQAMENGGILRVTTGCDASRLEVRVADSGPGIAPEVRAMIFNPFFTTKKTGTGLGLAVSYGIVQALGGALDVDSEPGRGATFTVHLPMITKSH